MRLTHAVNILVTRTHRVYERLHVLVCEASMNWNHRQIMLARKSIDLIHIIGRTTGPMNLHNGSCVGGDFRAYTFWIEVACVQLDVSEDGPRSTLKITKPAAPMVCPGLSVLQRIHL
jgi:hypothetical protein